MTRSNFPIRLALLAPALTALLPAQHSAPTQSPTPTAPGAFRAPVHRAPGEAEAWCSGDTFKASFDAGFTFYPLLGEAAPQNLPLRWDTSAIRLGATPLDIHPADTRISPARYEILRGDATSPELIERYDVRVDGIEQSFVLASLPQGNPDDDLTVEGRLTTTLHAAPITDTHRALDFADADGIVRVRYGAATVFDAAGRSAALPTSWDGDHITLRVPGTWLATATFPITVDPLTSAVNISIDLTNAAASYPTVGRDDLANELMFAYSRAFSAGDFDLFVHLTDDDFSNSTLVFSDSSAARSTRRSSVDFVRGPSRWVCAYGIENVTHHIVRLYFHDGADRVYASGSILDVPLDFANHAADPSFGGCRTVGSDFGYLAFRREANAASTNNADSEVIGVLVDARHRTLGTRRNLHTAGTANYDAEYPSVSPQASSVDGWVVAWQEYNYDNANDDWDILAQRVAADGSLVGADLLGNQASSGSHKLRPVVAGSAGRYLVAFTTRPNAGKNGLGSGGEIRSQRFDWPVLSANASVQTTRVITSNASPTILLRDNNAPIAFDTLTMSHWAVAWHRADVGVSVARLGYEGRVVEEAVAYPTNGNMTGIWPSLCFDDDDRSFVLTHATNSNVPWAPVPAMRFTYGNSSAISSGIGCAGSLSVTNVNGSLPHAGSEFFGFAVQGARPGAATWLFASISFLAQPMPAGGPGCQLLLNTNVPLTTVANGFTDGVGNIAFPFPLPDTVSSANVVWQAVQLDLGQLWSTQAVSTLIR